MNLEELNIILANGENTRTEYKQARNMVQGSFYETVVSFLNREGGVLSTKTGWKSGTPTDRFLREYYRWMHLAHMQKIRPSVNFSLNSDGRMN